MRPSWNKGLISGHAGFNSATGTQIPGALGSFMAFGTGFTGGVFGAAGDGKADIICGAGAGGGPNVRVFSGSNNALQKSFFAFDPDFLGGVFVG